MTSVKEWIDKKIEDGDIKYFEYDEFSLIKEIGRGAFCKVSRAYLASSKLEVALKTFVDENSSIEEEILNEFVRELNLLRKVCHDDNINSFLGITKNLIGDYIMVLEYANEGNLREYLKKKFLLLKWKDKIQMALDITRGLKYLHSEEIVHRDLHSKNILVNDGKLLIADLGLSKKLAEISSNSKANKLGMVEYIDPRCHKITKFKKDKKSDIYGLGVLLWEITSGNPPFSDHSQDDLYALVIKICCENLREDPIMGTPLKYLQLYQRCWDDDPKLRPDIEEVYEILSQLNQLTIEESLDLLQFNINKNIQEELQTYNSSFNNSNANNDSKLPDLSIEPDLRNLLIVCLTSCGKSALCNVLTETNDFRENESPVSETSNFQKKYFEVNGTKFCVVDTVGFKHTKLSTKEVLNKIEEGIYSMPEGISQILYVIDGRFTTEEIRIFELLEHVIVGSGILEYVTFVRTKFGNFKSPTERKKEKDKILEENGKIAKIVNSCNKVVYVDNPPINNHDYDSEDIENNKKTRAKSRTILLDHLEKVCQEKYFELKTWNELYPRIVKYLEDREKRLFPFLAILILIITGFTYAFSITSEPQENQYQCFIADKFTDPTPISQSMSLALYLRLLPTDYSGFLSSWTYHEVPTMTIFSVLFITFTLFQIYFMKLLMELLSKAIKDEKYLLQKAKLLCHTYSWSS
ncbi:kinase-like domain-containing protein [Glomus cerebriforme]|uniref:Kinase-like domain-containing protein n=1 Tax=Glomus cerebriforme TaxID=658196 RepID=A0A397TDF9_9GLOM|nr:kinase-like domain-containing protein [Glomus cerebriforme]